MDIILERVLSLIPRKEDGKFVFGAQAEFAKKLGFKDGHVISEWIAGKNTSYKNYLYQISKEYDVSVEWLKGTSDEQKKYPADFSEVDQELFDLMTKMRDRPDLRSLLYSASDATPEQVQGVADMFERFKQG